MIIKKVLEIVRQVETLSLEEQLSLIAFLAEKARQTYQPSKARRHWREICGAAPYPLTGKDAQAWVSHARQEDDQARQSHSGGKL